MDNHDKDNIEREAEAEERAREHAKREAIARAQHVKPAPPRDEQLR